MINIYIYIYINIYIYIYIHNISRFRVFGINQKKIKKQQMSEPILFSKENINKLLSSNKARLALIKLFFEIWDVLRPFNSLNDIKKNKSSIKWTTIIILYLRLNPYKSYFKDLLKNNKILNDNISIKLKIAFIMGILGHFIIIISQNTVYKYKDYNISNNNTYTKQGIFSVVRHPSVTGTILAGFGSALYKESRMGIIIMVIVTLLLIYNALKSEKNAIKDGDNELESYKKDTKYIVVPGIL